jgi:FKBP-type peptidyl-prolyl cis-trans isomerase FklB
MNKIKLITLALGGVLFLSSINAQEMDTLSYSLGVLVAQNLKNQGFEKLDAASLSQAVNDVIAGNETKMSAEAAGQFVNSYMEKKQAAQFAQVEESNKKFFADNGAREEVVTLASGLQYEILKEGTGEKPKSTNKVTVHYHGTLLDGTVFDSSVQRGEPASFGVTQVIKGWTEALQLMPEGSKWRLYIPHDLAYGTRGAGGKIQPYAALIFEVELLGIE